MFKMLIGNVLFFAVLVGWFLYTDRDRSLLAPGVILAFCSFICGIVMGYVLHSPPKRRSAAASATTAPAFVAGHPDVNFEGDVSEHEVTHVEVPAEAKLMAFIDGPGAAFQEASHAEIPDAISTPSEQEGIVTPDRATATSTPVLTEPSAAIDAADLQAPTA